MGVYWVTFRLVDRTVEGRSYSDRYQALVDAANEHATDAWDEPTSFWLIESSSTRAQIAASMRRAIATSSDLVLIGSMEHTGATLIGTTSKLAALKRLVPNLIIS